MDAARPVLALMGVFGVSRALYAIAGVRFETTASLETFMHFIDVRLLRHDMWNSVWHFHAQPPLFNVFLGVVLHLPGGKGFWFEIVYLSMGAAVTVTMFLLTLGTRCSLRAGVRGYSGVCRAAGHGAVRELPSLHISGGAAAVGERPLSVRYLRSRRPLFGFLFFGTLAVLVLTRSTFHLVWLIAVAAAVLILRAHGVVALPLLLMPLVVVSFWYTKNWVQFGTTSSSSWAGMNLAKVTLQEAADDEVDQMVRRGELSPQALIPPFSPPEAYQPLPSPPG